MDVKTAVIHAVEKVAELFEHENLSNLGLEEVEFDPMTKEWHVTVGFSRPWDYPQTTNSLAALASQTMRPTRSFKIVTISDTTNTVVAIKNRPNSN